LKPGPLPRTAADPAPGPLPAPIPAAAYAVALSPAPAPPCAPLPRAAMSAAPTTPISAMRHRDAARRRCRALAGPLRRAPPPPPDPRRPAAALMPTPLAGWHWLAFLALLIKQAGQVTFQSQ
jgi:DNA polymerase-3 subunit gamma/tau